MRSITAAFVSSAIAALLGLLAWALLFAEFADIPSVAAYPPNWLELSGSARVQWLTTHTITRSGFQALQYILEHPREFVPELFRFFGLLFFTALCAVALSRVLRRRAP